MQWLEQVSRARERQIVLEPIGRPEPGDAPDLFRRLWAERRYDAAIVPERRGEIDARIALITHGIPTNGFKTTGALLYLYEDSNRYAAFCSGTLIGDRYFLTAAHCFDHLEDEGNVPTESLRVYLQDEGMLEIVSVESYCSFEPTCDALDDLAVATLEDRQMTIAPLPLTPRGVALSGILQKMVGFGTDHNGYTGVKQHVEVAATDCPSDERSICYPIEGDQPPAACYGDSGGPMTNSSADAASRVLVGAARWTMEDCHGGTGVHTRIAYGRFQDWLNDSNLTGTDRLLRPVLGEVQVHGFLSPETVVPVVHTFEVPAGTDLLRVTINHDEIAPGHEAASNRFDLELVYDADPAATAACSCEPRPPAQFSHCHCSKPLAGTWKFQVERKLGHGYYQLTAMALEEVN